MRILLISPQPPQHDGKGYTIRAAALLEALRRNHQVELFVPAAPIGPRVLAAIRDLLAGRPAQVGFSMPPAEWARAVQAAEGADAVVAITVRAVRGQLGAPLIVDHVDALSLNWTQRADGPEDLVRRLVARLEAIRLGRWEGRVAQWAAGQLVVSEQEAAALPSSPPVHVLPHVVTFEPPPESERDLDVVFTGNMRYPPNKHAALWLDREIVPALRLLSPGARVVVAGRDADRLRLRNAEPMPNVPSIPAVLARSRVAIVPLPGLGTGVPTKALEAAACGAALVVTPWMHERLPLPARVAADAAGLAAQAAALLADEPARAALAAQARAELARYGVSVIAEQLDRVLAGAVETSAVRGSSGTLRRRCPVCEGGRARLAWREGGYRYVRCSSCGVLFSDVDRAEYEQRQHNAWHDSELSADTVAFYGTARALVHERFLERYRPSGAGRLLDVGCGLGFFVSRAMESGWDAFGCDPSPAWATHARNGIGAERIVLGGAEDLDSRLRFDMITVWDVFEHVFEPRPFLAALARLLSPGGRVFIRTPNEAWVYPTYAVRRAVMREQVELGPLNHVVYYRAATLRRALQAGGLRPVEWPGFPPPQVGYANRRPSDAGRQTLITRAKNAHAWGTRSFASASGGAIVLGADLDVLAIADGKAQ
jgi:2-polyprenyl-3-methyl-5-hydroxy-6-metoxy-1,4-benzoquinol methylase/glycosyltransferase involved in cell wall biosynthesis